MSRSVMLRWTALAVMVAFLAGLGLPVAAGENHAQADAGIGHLRLALVWDAVWSRVNDWFHGAFGGRAQWGEKEGPYIEPDGRNAPIAPRLSLGIHEDRAD
jgi:hypothetical protein